MREHQSLEDSENLQQPLQIMELSDNMSFFVPRTEMVVVVPRNSTTITAELGPGFLRSVLQLPMIGIYISSDLEAWKLKVASSGDGWAAFMSRSFVDEAAGTPLDILEERHTSKIKNLIVWDPFLRHTISSAGEISKANRSSRQVQSAYASAIAFHLNRLLADTGVDPSSGLSTAKRRAIDEYIRQNLGETIRVEDLVHLVHLSPSHFFRVFKRSTGLRPHEYVTNKRIETASQLLMDDDIPIIEIASKVGFVTQQHFTVVFRKHTGLTPRQFRLHSRFYQTDIETVSNCGRTKLAAVNT